MTPPPPPPIAQCDAVLPSLALIVQCAFCIQVFMNQTWNSQPVPEIAHSMPFEVLLNWALF